MLLESEDRKHYVRFGLTKNPAETESLKFEGNKNRETANLLGAADVEKASEKIEETLAPSSKILADMYKSFGSVS